MRRQRARCAVCRQSRLIPIHSRRHVHEIDVRGAINDECITTGQQGHPRLFTNCIHVACRRPLIRRRIVKVRACENRHVSVFATKYQKAPRSENRTIQVSRSNRARSHFSPGVRRRIVHFGCCGRSRPRITTGQHGHPARQHAHRRIIPRRRQRPRRTPHVGRRIVKLGRRDNREIAVRSGQTASHEHLTIGQAHRRCSTTRRGQVRPCRPHVGRAIVDLHRGEHVCPVIPTDDQRPIVANGHLVMELTRTRHCPSRRPRARRGIADFACRHDSHGRIATSNQHPTRGEQTFALPITGIEGVAPRSPHVRPGVVNLRGSRHHTARQKTMRKDHVATLQRHHRRSRTPRGRWCNSHPTWVNQHLFALRIGKQLDPLTFHVQAQVDGSSFRTVRFGRHHPSKRYAFVIHQRHMAIHQLRLRPFDFPLRRYIQIRWHRPFFEVQPFFRAARRHAPERHTMRALVRDGPIHKLGLRFDPDLPHANFLSPRRDQTDRILGILGQTHIQVHRHLFACRTGKPTLERDKPSRQLAPEHPIELLREGIPERADGGEVDLSLGRRGYRSRSFRFRGRARIG